MEEFLSKICSGKVLILLENIHPCIFLFKIYPLSILAKIILFLYTPFINFCEDKKQNKKRTLSVGTHFNLAYNYASIDQ